MKSSIELKTIAKQRMAPRISPLTGAVIIYGAILVGISFIVAFIFTSNLLSQGVFASEEELYNYLMNQMESGSSFKDTAISYGFEILIGALLSTLTAGISYVCLKAARNQEVKATDIFEVYKMNPDRIIIIYLVGFVIKFIFMLPSTILSYVAPAGETLSIVTVAGFGLEILGLIAQVAVTVFLSQAYFLYIDDPEQNSLITIKMSVQVMKKYWFHYLYLMLSFLPWVMAIALTCGIAAIWIVPYQNITYALFYMNLRGELGHRIDTAV